MDALILSRCSTAEQREALPAQLVKTQKYCLEKHLKIMEEISFDESAWKEKREKFAEVMEKLKSSKELTALVCDKVDRLIRNFSRDLATLEELRKQGRIELHFPSDNIVLHKDSPACDLFRFTMGVSLAKYYSDAISDNVKRVSEYKIKNGEFPSKAPFGYKNIEKENETRDIVIDPVRAPIVRKIFTTYATGNSSIRKIIEEINELGIMTNTTEPRPLSNGTVDHILNNTFYFGLMKVNGQLKPHRYPPIISKHLYDKVQAVRAGYHKKPFSYGAKPFIFRGLIKCADCGCTITAETSKSHIYYHCTNYKRMHDKRTYVKEEELLKSVSGILKNLQLSDEQISKLVDGLKNINESHKCFNKEAVSSLRQEYDKYEDRLNRATDLLLDGKLDNDIYNKKLKEIKDKQQDILNKMQLNDDIDEEAHITLNTVLSLAKRAYDIFKSSEVDEKRNILNFLLQNCELKEKKLLYKLKAPFDTVLKVKRCSIGLRGLHIYRTIQHIPSS